MQVPGKWLFELVTSDLMMLYRIKTLLYSSKSQYQQIELLETDTMGRSLVLDGKTQSAEIDEHIYHEALVHPVMLFHPNPQSVFVGGGGEGATLREILKHRSVKKVVMVDLDAEVVRVCRQFLPHHHQGAFDNPKVTLRHEDARKFLAESSGTFDVIILDLVDPLEGGASYLLYTQEFYQIARSKLNPGGLLVTQSGPTGILSYTECFTPVVHTLSTVFARVHPYTVFISSFVNPWGFTIALTNPKPEEYTPERIDRSIAERLPGGLRFYDGITHQHMSSLPTYLRQGIEGETRIVTDREPVFMT